jgi:hypothetical protein
MWWCPALRRGAFPGTSRLWARLMHAIGTMLGRPWWGLRSRLFSRNESRSRFTNQVHVFNFTPSPPLALCRLPLPVCAHATCPSLPVYSIVSSGGGSLVVVLEVLDGGGRGGGGWPLVTRVGLCLLEAQWPTVAPTCTCFSLPCRCNLSDNLALVVFCDNSVRRALVWLGCQGAPQGSQ